VPGKKKKREGPEPKRHQVVRYHDVQGRRCRKDTPGARKTVEETDTYYCRLVNPRTGERERISLETTDIQVAWEKLRRLQERRLQEELGIRDRFTDAAERPLIEHVEEWIASVRAAGVSPQQVQTLQMRVLALAERAGWKRLTDIDHDSAGRVLASVRDSVPGRRRVKGSIRTRNHYLKMLRQFVRWAAGPGQRLRGDPLAGIEVIDPSTDLRHPRRVPTPEEVAAFFEVLDGPAGIECEGMTAPQRALGYRVAMATGLRADELRSLTRSSFTLDTGAVTVPASYSKRRRNDLQLLPGWLVAQLRAWFEAGNPQGGSDVSCWPFPEHHPGKVLRLDLAAAGIPYSVRNAAGQPEFFDFHALRHWYCTWAAHLPGISPRTLLALTRHSSVELAMKVYGTALGEPLRAAIDQMPEIGRKKKE
jgi:integrase